MRWIGASLLLSVWLLSSSVGLTAEETREPGSALPLAPATPTEEAKVEGFRSALFGMTEAQLRQAIRKDFPAGGDKVASELNHGEKTTVLTVQASDLIPGTGKARVSYIIGYTTKKLIQVNITWIAEPKSTAAAENLVGAANLLRNYFLAGGYRPDTIIANQQMPNGYVVFRGLDARSRMVILVLTGATGTPPADAEKAPPVGLQLSYILDPEHPDVYQVPKGQF
ncbi:MAG: hypothetical protein WDO24_06700 [Pseudomonadota bacterium]